MSKRDKAEKKRARIAAEKARNETIQIIRKLKQEKEPTARQLIGSMGKYLFPLLYHDRGM